MGQPPLEPNQRTRDVYEHIGGYPQPPLIPLHPIDDVSSMARTGIALTPVSRAILKLSMTLTGYRKFHAGLAQNQEHYLRISNLRLPGLFAPVISATLALQDDGRTLSPAQRAATLIAGARHLHDELLSGRLPPDQYRGEPLEMGQYPNFFATSLVVEGKQARMFKSTALSPITVCIGRRLFQLEIGNPGHDTNVAQLAQALELLIDFVGDHKLTDKDAQPGILTGASNEVQFEAFKQLRGRPVNQASLHALRHSFLTLCLDLDGQPKDYAEVARLAHSGDVANRWWHASLQLVVFGNAKAAAICNFTTYLDGKVMMRGGAEIQRRAAALPLNTTTSAGANPLPPATELPWEFDAELSRRAWRVVRPLLYEGQATYEIPRYGWSWFHQHDLEAVPVFVLALQRAARQLTGQDLRITQFLTLSKYRCRDLTTTVVTTPENTQFLDYLDSPQPEPQRARELMKLAVESQRQEARAARKYLLMPLAMTLQIRVSEGLARPYLAAVQSLGILLLRLLGLYKPLPRQILISNPGVYPEVPIMGRPGARIPYVEHFGLHYQIMPDHIAVTMMPGPKWEVPNAEVVSQIQQGLERLEEVLLAGQPYDVPEDSGRAP